MQEKLLTVNSWAKDVGLSLGRHMTGEVGKIATGLAHSRMIPLLKDIDQQGTKRNLYPRPIIESAWSLYTRDNLNCPEVLFG